MMARRNRRTDGQAWGDKHEANDGRRRTESGGGWMDGWDEVVG